jgi:hypothetical protein
MYYRNPEGSKIAWQITPAEFDRWLAEVKAQAWEEGYNAKWVETYFYDNPYRKGYKNILQSPPLFPEHVGEGE